METLYREVVALLSSGEPFALATVVHASGSTPQKAGAKAIFLRDGRIVGTLGGGCMEAESRRRGLELIQGGEPLLYDLHLDDDFGWDDGLICGGTAQIFLQPMRQVSPEPFQEALSLLAGGGRGVLVTLIDAPEAEAVGVTRLVCEPAGNSDSPFSHQIEAAMVEAGRDVLAKEREEPCRVTLPDGLGTVYVEPILPRPTLLIAGAGHVGSALAHYGARLGFQVVVVDDRPSWANRERLPDADEILAEEIVGAVRRWPKTPQTYVVIVTRGHRNDAVVLREVIHSPVAYIGMIGSRRKVLTIYEEFLAEGIATAEQLARVHAPIGLDIGALSVDEIALSIAAELVAVRRSARSMPPSAALYAASGGALGSVPPDGGALGGPGAEAGARTQRAPSASGGEPGAKSASAASIERERSDHDHSDRSGSGGVSADGTAQGALAVRQAERDRHGRSLARALPDRRDPGRRRPPRECPG